MKGHALFQGEDNDLTISSPDPLGQFKQILTQKGILCKNERSQPFPRRDNYEIAKIHRQYLKSSPEPLGQFQPTLTQNILGSRGFKIVQMKGHTLSQGKIIRNREKTMLKF